MIALYGMLDSPFVRRVAISLSLYELPFEHYPLSVFKDYQEFKKINPVVKAPTLKLDNGVVLMDSSLILSYFESIVPAEKRLMPLSTPLFAKHLHQIGLALTACEKGVQISGEINRRPVEQQSSIWLDRNTEQLLAAFQSLEMLISSQNHDFSQTSQMISQADITTVVAWSYTQYRLANRVEIQKFPHLHQLANTLENLPIFKKNPIE